MSYLRNVLVHSGVQHILGCVLICCCLMYPMVPFSLNSPIVIVPSVFSNVYLIIGKHT